MPSRQQLTKTRSGGGKLLLRRRAPLTRRTVAQFCTGAHSPTLEGLGVRLLSRCHPRTDEMIDPFDTFYYIYLYM
jgi:hypothetical protein